MTGVISVPKNENLRGVLRVTSYAPSGAVTGENVFDSERFTNDFDIPTNTTTGDFHAPNAYAYRGTRIEYPRGSILEFTNGVKTNLNTGDLGLGALDPLAAISEKIPNDETRNYNRALTKLNDKVRGGLDLSTSVLEFSQTQKMLAGAGKAKTFLGNTINKFQQQWNRLPKSTRRVISRRYGIDTSLDLSSQFGALISLVPVKQLMKDLGGNWLQWHLGLRPLIEDFHDSVKEAYTGVIPRVLRFESKVYTPIVVNSIDKARAYYTAIKPTVTGQQGVHFRVQFRPPAQVNLSRWTSLNPVSWAWELLPLSFVVDYFYDIGNMLRDAETAILYDVTFDSGYVTFLKAYSGPINAKGVWRSNSTYLYQVDFKASIEFVDFRRTVMASWPIPRKPVFQIDLGSKQLLTLASLLAVKLGR